MRQDVNAGLDVFSALPHLTSDRQIWKETDMSDEPTHAIPRALLNTLLEAKEWCDERAQLEETIRSSTGPGSAQRNQEDRDEMDRRAGAILADIVEAIEDSWGFGRELKRSPA